MAFFLFFICCLPTLAISLSFSIDYDNNCFMKDGKPFRYISGGMHYFRVPQYYWKDRLLKLKASGMNTVQTYVPWNLHEPIPKQYNFAGNANLTSFLEIAQSLDLLVILRPGPYICAEWDFGGLPGWLLKDPSIVIRSSQGKAYMEAVDAWMSVLLPLVKPFLYENGGPVIMVQVENEYGDYIHCDHQYLLHLQQLFRYHLTDDIILFTTDDGSNLTAIECGTLPSLYTTVDFGANTDPSIPFANQQKLQQKGPLVNSEFYTGWLDYWGTPHQTRTSKVVADALDKILALNASVNLYMFEGGTNFGFWSGADFHGQYQPVPTSYDYDAPLTEAGDLTEKYHAIREVIGKYLTLPDIPIPPATPKYPYGTIEITKGPEVIDVLTKLSPEGPVKTKYPLTMEQIGQYSGFAWYHAQIPPMFSQSERMLNVEGLVHDRAIIYVGRLRQRTLNRTRGESNATIIIGEFLDLDILVENMGHVGYGENMVDPKGILGNVTIDNVQILNWDIYRLNLDNVVSNESLFKDGYTDFYKTDNAISPRFFKGVIPGVPFGDIGFDFYLHLDNWGKGVVFVNGHNMGRYWPADGPQQTLYVPASVMSMNQHPSNLVILELDNAPCDYPETCLVKCTTIPVLNGTTSPIYGTAKTTNKALG
ncbi:beta-galactosidase [Nematostella vectensis]|uniref:beta-galactosidase n=1 Tax=Nematostella vectensis TaxID=45351 RepID=UPI002076F59E|nr:beta-galactosidase [Nematostella vectensis]